MDGEATGTDSLVGVGTNNSAMTVAGGGKHTQLILRDKKPPNRRFCFFVNPPDISRGIFMWHYELVLVIKCL